MVTRQDVKYKADAEYTTGLLSSEKEENDGKSKTSFFYRCQRVSNKKNRYFFSILRERHLFSVLLFLLC